jgi:hypothetical protein
MQRENKYQIILSQSSGPEVMWLPILYPFLVLNKKYQKEIIA